MQETETGIMTANAAMELLQQRVKELEEQVEKWRNRTHQLETERWGLIWT